LNFVKNHFITAAFKSFPAWEETPPGPRLPRDVIENFGQVSGGIPTPNGKRNCALKIGAVINRFRCLR
jgi:hypothetical protein